MESGAEMLRGLHNGCPVSSPASAGSPRQWPRSQPASRPGSRACLCRTPPSHNQHQG